MSSPARRRFLTALPALVLLVVTAVLLPAASKPAAPAAVDSCSLLTKAQIQEILGVTVKEKVNTGAVRAASSACEYMVGDYGVFSLLLTQPVAAGYADTLLASFKRNKMKTVDEPGLGDRSFFAMPGYGMTQLNTVGKSSYLLITMLVPGKTEDQLKPLAVKLMKLALAKL